jgi:protein TonB|tara:strand:- start:894 stop:1274 length:381 start_codon:yes stop_codon:yes gene_type:complete
VKEMKNKSLPIFLFCFSILFGQQMDKDSIYLNVEKMPIIKGGFAAVGKKIKYPNIAKQMGMQGVVYIGFIVNSEGKVENPKILKSVAKILDEEAIRVVEKEIEFEPGYQEGKAVPVRFVLPIKFKL